MAKPNIFDRAVIAVAPVHAAKRAAAMRSPLPEKMMAWGRAPPAAARRSRRANVLFSGRSCPTVLPPHCYTFRFYKYSIPSVPSARCRDGFSAKNSFPSGDYSR